ncbi:MAG: wax ester/triacylglycerol synthase domain-containing protein [Ilumatobacteraceae bacterium]
MAQIVYDRTRSDADGLMWRLEKDPYLASTFANVTILDRKPNFDVLRRRMERTVMRIPRLRQRVQTSPGNVSAPVWVDDPDFDIDLHVRRIALTRPGTDRQLLDLATLITADPFDRTRPLWQFVIVEGVQGGRAALIEKLHHTITDGEGGVQLSLEFLDFERDAPELPMPATLEDVNDGPAPADSVPGDSIRDLLAGSLRIPLGIVRQVRDLLADPTQIPDATAAAGDTFRAILNEFGDTEKARSPLWRERSLRRHLEVASAPFTETRASAHKLGGTLNTAFLTVAAEAAGCYHAQLGEPVESLRASMAISTRTEHSGANAFSLVRMLVPTGDIPIDERFKAIHESSQTALGQSKYATLDSLAAFASALPTSIVTRIARQQTQTVDFATSNVKGAPVPMFAAGAKLLHNYPVGPLSGVAFNLTLLSYLGNLDMGLNCDAAAVTEPALMKECLDRAISDFLAIAG